MSANDAPRPFGVIGIDVGTANSCMAIYRGGVMTTIPDRQGNTTMPSVVAFTDRDILVGHTAVEQAAANPRNTIAYFKRLIGARYEDIDLTEYPFSIIPYRGRPMIVVEHQGQDVEYTPEEILCLLIKQLKKNAEDYLGHAVNDALMTVPAHFNTLQRSLVRESATKAQLRLCRICDEPSAVAVLHSMNTIRSRGFDQSETTFMILDMGAGTFDVTIALLEDSICEVQATRGSADIGGRLFDDRLLTFLVEDFKDTYEKDLTTNQRSLTRLRAACERVKRDLSYSEMTELHLESLFDGIDFHKHITRQKFDELSEDLFSRTIDFIESARQKFPHNTIRSIGSTPEDSYESREDKARPGFSFDDMILVGGCRRIPRLQERLSQHYQGHNINSLIQPDEAVAQGAAVYAAVVWDPAIHSPFGESKFLHLDALSTEFFIRTWEDPVKQLLFPCNTMIPIKKILDLKLDTIKHDFTVELFEGLRANQCLIGLFNLVDVLVDLDVLLPGGRIPEEYQKVQLSFDFDASRNLGGRVKFPLIRKSAVLTWQYCAPNDARSDRGSSEYRQRLDKFKRDHKYTYAMIDQIIRMNR